MLAYEKENEYETGNLVIPVVSECWRFNVCEGEKKENNVGATALHFQQP